MQPTGCYCVSWPHTQHPLQHTQRPLPHTQRPLQHTQQPLPQVRFRFISFLNMLAKGDADRATHHLLQWSSSQTCRDPAALLRDMRALLAEQGDIHSAGGIDLDAVLKAILRLARAHTVRWLVCCDEGGVYPTVVDSDNDRRVSSINVKAINTCSGHTMVT